MWSDHEAQIALRLARARSVEVAARVVGRKPSEIEALLRNFPLVPWTDNERETLRHYLVKYDVEKCGYLLNRTPEEIVAEAERLGILVLDEVRHSDGKKIMEKEKSNIASMIRRGRSYPEIAKITGRSIGSIKTFVYRSGLVKGRKA